VSFVIVGWSVREAPRAQTSHIDLLATPLCRWIASPPLALALKLLALAAFLVTVLAGLRGDQNPYRNIAPTMLWIIVWVGLAYVSAFVGNVWALINPWRTISEAIEPINEAIPGRRELSLRFPSPPALGLWPAFILLLAFAWLELVYPSPAVPRLIAALGLVYSALTFAGM